MKTLCEINKKCDGCCCRNLLLGTIATWEAHLIFQYVSDSPEIKKRLEQLMPEKEAEYEKWKKIAEKALDEETCVKLAFRYPFQDNETNKCLVYAVRPVNCRTYYVKKKSHCPYGYEDLQKNPSLAGKDSEALWKYDEGMKYIIGLTGTKPAIAGKDSEVVWKYGEKIRYILSLTDDETIIDRKDSETLGKYGEGMNYILGLTDGNPADFVNTMALFAKMNKNRSTLMVVSKKLGFFSKNIVVPKSYPAVKYRDDLDAIEGDYFPVC